MGGKTVILSVLIMSLVLAQIQVEARVCCQSQQDKITFETCRMARGTRTYCASMSGCIIVSGYDCPSGYPKDNLQNSGGDAVTEYCKLGCASSVCGALITLQNSDASEIVNGAVENCTKACSTLCTKGSKPALKTA